MTRDLELRCKCGQVQGQLSGIKPSRVSRVTCHCADCRAYATHVGISDCHNENGGMELFLTLPGRLTFTNGFDNLKSLRIGRGGILRWYAGCCGTPMGNMLPKPGIRFTSLPMFAIPNPDDKAALGPLAASVFADEAPDGTTPPADFGGGKLKRQVVTRHLASLLGLAPSGSPYFGEDGNALIPSHFLTEEERAAAYQ